MQMTPHVRSATADSQAESDTEVVDLRDLRDA